MVLVVAVVVVVAVGVVVAVNMVVVTEAVTPECILAPDDQRSDTSSHRTNAVTLLNVAHLLAPVLPLWCPLPSHILHRCNIGGGSREGARGKALEVVVLKINQQYYKGRRCTMMVQVAKYSEHSSYKDKPYRTL